MPPASLLIQAMAAHTARTQPSYYVLFRRKQLGLLLLPPGWDTSPSQGYSQQIVGIQLYTWVERGNMEQN